MFFKKKLIVNITILIIFIAILPLMAKSPYIKNDFKIFYYFDLDSNYQGIGKTEFTEYLFKEMTYELEKKLKKYGYKYVQLDNLEQYLNQKDLGYLLRVSILEYFPKNPKNQLSVARLTLRYTLAKNNINNTLFTHSSHASSIRGGPVCARKIIDEIVVALKKFSQNLYDKPFEKTTTSYVKPFSYIKLTANKKNVDIYLNGSFIGKFNDKPLVKKIESGDIQVTAKKKYFESVTLNTYLSKNDILEHNFELKLQDDFTDESKTENEESDLKGDLLILTEKNYYKIKLDSLEKIPPIEFNNIRCGTHQLTIKFFKNEKIINIFIKQNETTIIDLDKILN